MFGFVFAFWFDWLVCFEPSEPRFNNVVVRTRKNTKVAGGFSTDSMSFAVCLDLYLLFGSIGLSVSSPASHALTMSWFVPARTLRLRAWAFLAKIRFRLADF